MLVSAFLLSHRLLLVNSWSSPFVASRVLVPNGVKLALFLFSFVLHWTLSALMFPQSVLLGVFYYPTINQELNCSSLRKATMIECHNFFLYILAFLLWKGSHFFNIVLFLLFPLIGCWGNF